jgi:predicted nuclease with TOPRIM domain
MHAVNHFPGYQFFIDKKISDLEYECSKKDEEIKKSLDQIEHLSEELQVLKENLGEDQELLDMIKIHSSCPDFLEIIKAYIQDRKANPVYYRLLTKAINFDFLQKNLGMGK